MIINKPIYSLAEGINGKGNLAAIEETILLMKQDFEYLDNEIQRLKGECER